MSRGAQRSAASGWETCREVMHRPDVWLTAADELPRKRRIYNRGIRASGYEEVSSHRGLGSRRGAVGPTWGGIRPGEVSSCGGLAGSVVLSGIQEVLRPYFGAQNP